MSFATHQITLLYFQISFRSITRLCISSLSFAGGLTHQDGSCTNKPVNSGYRIRCNKTNFISRTGSCTLLSYLPSHRPNNKKQREARSTGDTGWEGLWIQFRPPLWLTAVWLCRTKGSRIQKGVFKASVANIKLVSPRTHLQSYHNFLRSHADFYCDFPS